MRVAAIDIGTNSTRLLVAELKDGRAIPLYRDLQITRLGRNVNQSRKLDETAMAENVEVLADFRAKAISFGAEGILAVATSAVRDAENRERFLAMAQEGAGVNVQIITGVKEAALSYLGVLAGFDGSVDNALVCDVGGGSTELISGPDKAVSIDVGAVRLTEMFLFSDPPVFEEIASLRKYVRERLSAQAEGFCEEITLIGVGGTITSLAAMEQEMDEYIPEKIQGYLLKREALQRQVEKLSALSVAEKRKLKGLQPKRADVILAGALIIEELMDYFAAPSITVSDADILLGIIYDYMRNIKT